MIQSLETNMDHSASDVTDIIGDKRNIIPFYLLLNELGKELLKCELQQALILCTGQGIPPDKLQTDEPVELLRTLDVSGIIGEDHTDFLKQILDAAGCVVGKDAVEEYEKERLEHLKNVEVILGKKDPLFVGRTKFVSKILQVFRDESHSKCRCVLVYGLAGTGKTKLAVESCAIYKEQKHIGARLFRVNLRKATKVDEVWLWTLNSVTGGQITQNQFNMTMVKNWILKCSQDTTILLDNADDILNPSSFSKDHFINTLADILALDNTRVKILLTSRHPVDFKGLKDLPNFLELKLEPLQVHESLSLLNKMVIQAEGSSRTVVVGGEALRDEVSLIEIAKLCGNNPQALRAVASRLSNGFSPEKLVEDLKKPNLVLRVLDPGSLAGSAAVQDERKDFEDQPMVLSSLSAMYEQLPKHLKEALLKLSVFPSSFSLTQGANILGNVKPDEAKYDLEDLKKWSLVERDQFDVLDTGLSEGEPYYYIHPLVRSVSLTKVQSSEIYKVAYEGALHRYFVYINELLKELTQLGHKDFSRALAKFQLEKTNVFHYLELDMGNKFGCEVISGEQKSSNPVPLPDKREGIYSIFETFLDPSKRLEYYENMSRLMLSRNEIEAWAYLQGWVGDEIVVKAEYDKAWEIVEEPLKVLKIRASEKGTTNDLERAQAQLFYVKGRILVGRRKYRDGIEMLKTALSMQKRLLGDHSVTARCLNALGHAYYNKADEDHFASGVDEAHEYHKKTWEMLVNITNGQPEKHFDAPMYLLNIGASYHQMGKKCGRKKKAEKYFLLAITNYNEAHELERSLKLTNSPNTAFLMKNMAMSYCEMEDYEKALPLAINAGEIREKSIGVHPTTARNLYFIGSLYDSLGDKYEKTDKAASIQHFNDALEYYNRAFKMETELGPTRHSIEYDDLKADTEMLLKKLHMDKDLDKYRRLFKEADKGTVSVEEVTAPAQRDVSINISMDGEDMVLLEDDGPGENETAGVSRRRPPGPVFLEDERPRKCCVLS